jgi:hypothetical protein
MIFLDVSVAEQDFPWVFQKRNMIALDTKEAEYDFPRMFQ